MGYLTSELLSELLIAIGNRSDATFNEAWRLRKLNMAYREVWSGFMLPELENRVYATIDANQRIIQLPSDCFAVLSVRDSTNGRRLRSISYIKMDDKEWTVGVPARYMRYGKAIELDPYWDSAWECKLRYQQRPSDLSDGVNSALASEWDEAILLGGEWRAFKDLGNLTRMMEVKNEYLAYVRSRVTQPEYEAEDSDFGLELRME